MASGKIYNVVIVDPTDTDVEGKVFQAQIVGGYTRTVIELTGESGTLTDAEIALVESDSVDLVLVNDGQVFYLSNKQSDLTYKTFMNIDAALDAGYEINAIYIQLNPEAVNYGAWSKEQIS